MAPKSLAERSLWIISRQRNGLRAKSVPMACFLKRFWSDRCYMIHSPCRCSSMVPAYSYWYIACSFVAFYDRFSAPQPCSVRSPVHDSVWPLRNIDGRRSYFSFPALPVHFLFSFLLCFGLVSTSCFQLCLDLVWVSWFRS